MTLHPTAPGMWLAHPEWTDDCVDITEYLGLECLQVELMHPVDLIVSKLIRWNERDAYDANRLMEAYNVSPGTFGQRLDKAVRATLVSDWNKEQLSAILRELFPDPEQFELLREEITTLPWG